MILSKLASWTLPLLAAHTVLGKDWESPAYTWLYQYPLPIPPVKTPLMSITNPVTGNPIDYYEVYINAYTQTVYPNKSPVNLVGYDGMSPGPTFIIDRGRETVVRFVNNASMANSVHLHGSPTRAPWDGWAEDITQPGEFKDYYYPNNQPGRMLWYHDHAIEHTAENAYFGQAGAYILRDPAEDALGLPSGYGVHDIPLILTSKYYQNNGQLVSPAGETDSLYGDVIHVNGQPWPYLNVPPRKTGSTAKIPFQVIASDAGLLTGPVTTDNLWISMGERYEIVVDFSSFAGQNITMRNYEDVGKDDDYLHTNKVMRFVVSNTPVTDTSTVPSTLAVVDFPTPSGPGVDHHFEFDRSNGEWQINGIVFQDVNNRVLANVPRGTVEIWEFENGGGGWTHPIHVHLVDFRVLWRSDDDDRSVLPYEAAGLKDVVWLAPNEIVRVEAHYAPWGPRPTPRPTFPPIPTNTAQHEMMAAFNVTALADFGYPETDFSDPMEARWRAEAVAPSKFTPTAITEKVQFMASLEPYNNVDEIMEELDDYWASHKKHDAPATAPKTRTRRMRIEGSKMREVL